jgi:hypothetical protein
MEAEMFRSAFMVMAAFPVLSWSQSTNYVATAGYNFLAPTAVAPGQVVTLFVRGLNVPDAVADTVPLPRTLAGVTVVVKNPPTPNYPTTLPIFSVRSSFVSEQPIAFSTTPPKRSRSRILKRACRSWNAAEEGARKMPT